MRALRGRRREALAVVGSLALVLGWAWSASVTGAVNGTSAEFVPADGSTVIITIDDVDGSPPNPGDIVLFRTNLGLFGNGQAEQQVTAVTSSVSVDIRSYEPGNATVSIQVAIAGGALQDLTTFVVGFTVVDPPPPPPTLEPTPEPTPTVTPPAGGDSGTFDRPIPNVGVNTAVWNGGTVTQLAAAVAASGGISVTIFVDNQATVLIPGAPAFVNAAFNAAFPDGNVPAGTVVLVVR